MDLIERMPPQDREAEASVLGAILLDNEAAWTAAEKLQPEHFYDPAHQRIYAAILELTKAHKPVDIVILREQLQRLGQLEEIGGTPKLRELLEVVPTAANIAHYVDLVLDKGLLRNLIHVGTEIVKEAYNAERPAMEVLDWGEKRFFEVTQQRVTTTVRDLGSLVQEVFQRIDSRVSMAGTSTGLVDLDRMTNGLKPAELTILAARPSMGKTSLATTIMRNVCVNDRVPVAFFSLEMPADQVTQNLLCSHARVDSYKVRQGKCDQRDMMRLQEGAAELYSAPMFIDDSTGVTVMELRAKARKLKMKHGIGLIVIDYLQLMEADKSSKSDGRQQEISQISRGLKQLARELRIPVVALSQLSRAVESRENKRPIMSDLRESGAIEQDADMIWMLFREAYYKPDNPELANLAEVIVAKNRNGPTGDVRLFFHREYTRFDNELVAK